MNDDASPSSSAPGEHLGGVSAAASAQPQGGGATTAQRAEPPGQTAPQQRRPISKKDMKRSCPGLKRKLVFLTHLLKSLDLVVFAELSALYYMEYAVISPTQDLRMLINLA